MIDVTLADDGMEAEFDYCVANVLKCQYFDEQGAEVSPPADFTAFINGEIRTANILKDVDYGSYVGAMLFVFRRFVVAGVSTWTVAKRVLSLRVLDPEYIAKELLTFSIWREGDIYDVYETDILSSTNDANILVSHVSTNGIESEQYDPVKSEHILEWGATTPLEPHSFFAMLRRPASSDPWSLSDVSDVQFSNKTSAHTLCGGWYYSILLAQTSLDPNCLPSVNMKFEVGPYHLFACKLEPTSHFDAKLRCSVEVKAANVDFLLKLDQIPTAPASSGPVFSATPLSAAFSADSATPYDFFTATVSTAVIAPVPADVIITCDAEQTSVTVNTETPTPVTVTLTGARAPSTQSVQCTMRANTTDDEVTDTLTLPTFHGRWRDRCQFPVPTPAIGGCVVTPTALGLTELEARLDITNTGNADGSVGAWVSVAAPDCGFSAAQQVTVALDSSPSAPVTVATPLTFTVPEACRAFTLDATCNLAAQYDDCWFTAGADVLGGVGGATVARLVSAGVAPDVTVPDFIGDAVAQLHRQTVSSVVAAVVGAVGPWLQVNTPDEVALQVGVGGMLFVISALAVTIVGCCLCGLTQVKV